MFDVSCNPLPPAMLPIAKAFWEAVSCIGPSVRFVRKTHVTFATAPFRLNLPGGQLTYSPSGPETINVTIEPWVFVDCNKMQPLAYPFKVACILEELAHSIMHISDERLVSIVVASLYPGVFLVDGKYTPTDSASPAL